eukprot:augustus_masked-scaffold_52-processed-gene-0.34-mRNA-1 protein AED:0.00 eAED:0.00 QI:0/-1/0/1/-1/1/1/0/376
MKKTSSIIAKNIAVLPGDGIGPEVMTQAIKALNAVSNSFSHNFSFTHGLIGGAAYDKHKNHFPEETVELCKNSDAVLFGSVGGPVESTDPNHPEHEKYLNSEKNSILGLRKHFEFAINLRPCKIYSSLSHLSPLKDRIIKSNPNFVIIRELLGDVYFGEHNTFDTYATDLMTYTTEEITKPLLFAKQTASIQSERENSPTTVTVVDKANVLDTSRLWRKVAMDIFEGADSNLEFMFVDNAAMQLILNPSQFDIIVTSNLFGDILSDAASVLPGSLGLMPSASLNPETGLHMYEPSGGSAPDIAGKNVANPVGMILSAGMMLKYSFGLEKEAEIIDLAVEKVLEKGIVTRDLSGENGSFVGTEEFGDEVVKMIEELS